MGSKICTKHVERTPLVQTQWLQQIQGGTRRIPMAICPKATQATERCGPQEGTADPTPWADRLSPSSWPQRKLRVTAHLLVLRTELEL